jgi:hypothetical protein
VGRDPLYEHAGLRSTQPDPRRRPDPDAPACPTLEYSRAVRKISTATRATVEVMGLIIAQARRSGDDHRAFEE